MEEILKITKGELQQYPNRNSAKVLDQIAFQEPYTQGRYQWRVLAEYNGGFVLWDSYIDDEGFECFFSGYYIKEADTARKEWRTTVNEMYTKRAAAYFDLATDELREAINFPTLDKLEQLIKDFKRHVFIAAENSYSG